MTPECVKNSRMAPQLRLVLLVCLAGGWTPAAIAEQRSSAQRPAADEASIVAQGWALFAKGDLAGATAKAAEAVAIAPRGSAALSLGLEVEIARVNALSGLDLYEKWLGRRTLEEPGAIRRVARGLLRETALAEPDSVAAFEARRALAEDGDRGARAELSARLRSGGRAETRLLAALGDKSAIEALIVELEAPGNPVRVIQALGESQSASAVPALAQKLQDPRSEVRAAVADALGRIGAPGAVERLRPLLQDTSMHVKVKAASALLRLNDASGEPVFRELLDAAADSAPSRLVAAEAMAVRPDASWLALVRGLLEANESDVRLVAARLIAEHEPEAARTVFRSLQENSNPAIREEAARLAVGVGLDLTGLRIALRNIDTLTLVRAAGRILQLTR